MQLTGKKIVLGVSGGIAAYKSADLVRRLREQGAQIKVVMTQSSQAFITPLTMQAVSGQPVHDSLLDESQEAAMGHIALARWADLILIAPATANCLANLAQGLANDLLSTLCLATVAPILLAPAMNQQMWQAPAVQANAKKIVAYGMHLLGPDIGEQACGDVGPGRMLEPQNILQQVSHFFSEKQTQALKDKHVVITAGPTQEAIDPVRYISNHSSGKMGYALAQAASDAGATVTLISGPVQLPAPSGVTIISVISAEQMRQQALQQVDAGYDLFIGAAAVADYKPKQASTQKQAKPKEAWQLEMVANPDIISEVAKRKTDNQYVVGFAAETQDVEAKAKQKLARKELDMIIANQVAGEQGGFHSDSNAVSVLWDGGKKDFPLQVKSELAQQLIAFIVNRIMTDEKSPA